MTTSGRVLLADDSPHAQRMGERILREEGYEVVTVTDGETAIIRLKDVDPDVVIVDAFLPQVSGYDLCGFIKKQPQHSHVRVLLTSTALEKVDEDHAYKVGADGQLKKPFEASVMLKSLKDLIGGSDKKKRAGTTLDLSYVADETPAKPESPALAAEADSEQTSGEKPVSALQAWLQQHDSNALSASAEEEAKAPKPVETLAAAAGGAEAVAASEGSRLSNPQLLRRMDEEPEDLSLRNNPVAKLRYSPKPAAPMARGREVEQESLADSGAEQSRTAAEQGKGGVRSFRVQPINAPNPEPADAGEGPRTPRKSLLEQLEEFEKASESSEEPAAVAPVAKVIEPVAAPKEVPAPTKSSLEREVEETLAAQARLESESEAAEEEQEKLEVSDLPEDSDDEAFLLMRARKGRGSRPSLLESLGEVEEAQHEPASTVAVEAPEPDVPGAVPEPMVASVPPEPAVAPEPTVALEPAVAPMAVAAATAEVPALVAQAAAFSINEAGVRLDEEEVRAVVEIAVSAAMPTIVEEVSRCVLLALESRYADKVSQNGNHPHD